MERTSRAVGFAALAVACFWLILFEGIGWGDSCFGFTLVDTETGAEECEGFLGPLSISWQLALQLAFFLGAVVVSYRQVPPQPKRSATTGGKAVLKRLLGAVAVAYGWIQVLPLIHGGVLWIVAPHQDTAEPNSRLIFARVFIGGLAILFGHALRRSTMIAIEPADTSAPRAAASG